MQKKGEPPDSRFREALVEAEAAAREDEVPVGAIIFDKTGAIIGRGHNRREQNQCPTAHAEIIAINQAAGTLGSWRLINCVLVVTLEPCPMCLAACQQARLSEVFYGATDPKGGAISLGYKIHEDPRTHHRFPVTFESTSECGTILQNFFKSKRALK